MNTKCFLFTWQRQKTKYDNYKMSITPRKRSLKRSKLYGKFWPTAKNIFYSNVRHGKIQNSLYNLRRWL